MRLADDPNAELRRVCACGDHGHGHPESFDALLFTCPAGDGDVVLVRFVRDRDAFRLDEKTFVWRATGDFPNTISLHPSVHVLEGNGATHWHGFVRDGAAA